MRSKVICPHCQTSLRFQTPIEVGQTLSCHSCVAHFAVKAKDIVRNIPKVAVGAGTEPTDSSSDSVLEMTASDTKSEMTPPKLPPRKKSAALRSTPYHPPAQSSEDTQAIMNANNKPPVLPAQPAQPYPPQQQQPAPPMPAPPIIANVNRRSESGAVTWVMGSVAVVLFLAVAIVGGFALVSMQEQQEKTKANAVAKTDIDANTKSEVVVVSVTKEDEAPIQVAANQVAPNQVAPNQEAPKVAEVANPQPQPPVAEPDAPKAEEPMNPPAPEPEPAEPNMEPPMPEPVQMAKAQVKKTKKVIVDPKDAKYRQVLPPKKQEAVNQAIDMGVKYLRQIQNPDGGWDNGRYDVGHASLAGLTLLECGAKADDPAILKAASFVRMRLAELRHTYQLSLAILFLDKLGDPRDGDNIRILALRLIAGQTTQGGWNYNCPLLNNTQSIQLITFLRQTSPIPLENLTDKKLPDTKILVPTDKKVDLANLFLEVKPKPSNVDQVVDKGPKKPFFPVPNTVPKDNTSDDKPGKKTPIFPVKAKKPQPNEASTPSQKKPEPKTPTPPKNAAPKVDHRMMPVSKPFPKQQLDKGLHRLGIVVAEPLPKAFRPKMALRGASDDNSNSQFAMMALWAARRHGVPMLRTLALIDQRFMTSQFNGGWSYRYRTANVKPAMTCVGLIGLAMGHASHQDMVKKVLQVRIQQPEEDVAIQAGLRYIGKHIGDPAAEGEYLPMQNLYYLWSVERVAMLYGLKTIGNKDWYHWASDTLVANQRPDGYWTNGGYHGSNATLDTCFALLILRRANLVEDLTESIQEFLPVRDPDAALKQNIVVPEGK